MAVVEAKIQTVEDIYRLVWSAIASKQPIRAIYKERPRLFCPHRLGRNRAKQLRVLRYQYGGESESGLAAIGSPDNWRCVALEKLRRVELLEGSWKWESVPGGVAVRLVGAWRCRECPPGIQACD